MGTPRDSLETTVEPVTKPVTIAECKDQLGLDYDDHDALIDSLIHSAVSIIEAETNVDMAERTRVWKFRHLAGREIELPVAPVQSITSVTYVDTAGVTQTLSTSVWELDTGVTPNLLRRQFEQDWPTVRGGDIDVAVTMVTGYAGSGDSPPDLYNIPEGLRQAVIMLVAGMYRMPDHQTLDIRVYRENPTFKALLGPHRFWRPI